MDEQKKWITSETAAKIRYFRHQKCLSQEELALKANLNPAYFGQVERGLKCPTVDTLYKIATALEVPLPELLRFSSSSPSEEVGRLRDLITRIPPSKINQVLSIVEGIADLF